MAYDRDSDSGSKDSKDVSANGSHATSGETTDGLSSTKDGEARPGSSDESRRGPGESAAESTRADGQSSKRRRSMEARSRRSYDDDYDDEDEDEDEDYEEERRPVRRRRPKHRSARQRVPKRKRNVPTSEEALNIPKIQTIGMLGSISLLMIIIWFAAKLACNAHPDQIRDPRYVSVDQLARDPKNAALEFQLRYVGKDYLSAGEIAAGKMAEKIHELLTFCEGNVDSCEKDRLALKDKVTGTAALISVSPGHSTVEVVTYVNNENPQTVTLEMAPSGQVWKVAQSREGSTRTPDAGTVADEATQAPHPTQ
jgi:hypothetical protein